MRVLLVEDEVELAEAISKGLREASYAVDIAHDGEIALYHASENKYDIAIIDVMLPIMDGFTVCKELRQQRQWLPVLILSARDAVEDRVTGLNCGADDYLVKPFNFVELLARMRALTRRVGELRSKALKVADLELDTLSHSAIRGGKKIRLTAKEYALLEFLMLRVDQVLNRTTIAEHVWDENFDPFSNIIDAYIKRLRKKIDYGFAQPLIHTRRCEGYILSPDFAERYV